MMSTKKAKELLKDALKEHNNDCLLCAIKDTRINEALKAIDNKDENLKQADRADCFGPFI